MPKHCGITYIPKIFFNHTAFIHETERTIRVCYTKHNETTFHHLMPMFRNIEAFLQHLRFYGLKGNG
jgi:hypothetical protein